MDRTPVFVKGAGCGISKIIHSARRKDLNAGDSLEGRDCTVILD